MTEAEAKAIISEIEYKPGFTISLIPQDMIHGFMDDGGFVRVVGSVLDSRGSGAMGDVFSIAQLPPWSMVDEDILLRVVKMAIGRFEAHEIDEWFRCKGKLVHDPHAKENRDD